MRHRRRHTLLTLLLTGLGAMFLASSASADTGETTASRVYQIVTASTSYGTVGDWFHLDTTSGFSSCTQFEGRVAFKIQQDERGKRVLSLLQAALLSGKQVRVGYDTSKLTDGYCIAQWVRFVK